MIKIKVSKNIVSVQETEPLYSGAVDTHSCLFRFDSTWSDFSKSAVFRFGGKAVTVLLEDNCCMLPWEILTRGNIGLQVEVGVYGVSVDTEIMTSVWDSIGVIRDGTDLGNDAKDPSPGVYAQVLSSVRRVDEKVEDYTGKMTALVQRSETSTVLAVDSAARAADSELHAERAADSAQETLNSVRSALDNLPVGATLVVNDLSTGGANAALSAEMGKVLAQRKAVNLLDNSDWRNPVDQRHGYIALDGVVYYSDPELTTQAGSVIKVVSGQYVNNVYGSVTITAGTSGTGATNGTFYVAAGDLIRGYARKSGYTIDRWRTASALAVQPKDGCVGLTCISTSLPNGIAQDFPKERTPAPGSAVTVAAEDVDGNLYTVTTTMPVSGAAKEVSGSFAEFAYIKLYSPTEDASDFGRVSLMVKPEKTIDIKWIALYEGRYTADALPPYQSKRYGEELLECQRYRVEMIPQNSTSGVMLGIGQASSAMRADILIPLPAALRAAPTVTFSGNFILSPIGRGTSGIAVTGMTRNFRDSAGAIALTVATEGELVANQSYALIAQSSSERRSLLLDANL